MKIAIISQYSRIGDKTGDMVQADKTAAAIQDLGHSILRCYFKHESGEVFNENGELSGNWAQALGDCDIVHAIPPIPWQFLREQPKIKARLVCSTVFWRSFTYTRVIQKIIGKLTPCLVKDYLRTFFAWLGMPTYSSYLGYDLLLPNSEDEVVCFRRFCLIKRHAKIIAVPNAIDPLPGYVETLTRPSIVPNVDYVLVPGIFAPRKNQLAFIHAMRGLRFPIVFIGDGPLFDRCRKEATPSMYFLGHIAHGTKEFYSIMKFARVVCLPSNCETPGIALLEAAALGARPVVPYEGGTCQYYGWDAEYLDPLNEASMQSAVNNAWSRGKMTKQESFKYLSLTWENVALRTLDAYKEILK